MIVKCIGNLGKNLPKNALRQDFGIDHNYNLIINKYYIVYCMMILDGYFLYCICDENYNYCPYYNPSPLFTIHNNKLSKHWIFAYNQKNGLANDAKWAFPEWANDPYYFHNLVEGENKEKKIFRKYTALS